MLFHYRLIHVNEFAVHKIRIFEDNRSDLYVAIQL